MTHQQQTLRNLIRHLATTAKRYKEEGDTEMVAYQVGQIKKYSKEYRYLEGSA